MADAIREFDQKVRAVSEDRRTGVVTLTITWRDPVTSADWANELVARANQRMRASAIEEARSTIDFLSKRAESEESVSVREALFSAVETQYKSMALASARPDFAFRVIDAATAPDPDDVAFPNRLLFAATGALLGLLAAGILIAIAIQGHLSRAGPARAGS